MATSRNIVSKNIAPAAEVNEIVEVVSFILL